MDSHTFGSLVSSLKQGDSDEDKADAIKTTVQTAKCVSASQMAQLLKFISFDETKLEVAKAGYQYTTGPHSYGNTVGRVFSFIDDKEKSNAYILRNPHTPPSPPIVHLHFNRYD